MAGIEKVIKGLECCEASEALDCETRPYREGNYLDLICFDTLQADALETLKWAKRKIDRLKKILDIALKERPYIVQCKDCKSLNKNICGDGYCDNLDIFPDPDGFCADGKRKEEHDDQSI